VDQIQLLDIRRELVNSIIPSHTIFLVWGANAIGRLRHQLHLLQEIARCEYLWPHVLKNTRRSTIVHSSH